MRRFRDDFALHRGYHAGTPRHHQGQRKCPGLLGPGPEKIPDLNFKLIDVLAGVDSITIYYKAVFGKLALEVLFFDTKRQVKRGIAHYIG